MLRLNCSTNCQLSAIDNDAGIIKGTVITYNNIIETGRGNIVVEPKAFSSSIMNANRIKILRAHDDEKIIGKALSFDDSNDRLSMTAQLDIDVEPLAKTTFGLIKKGTLDSFSVGFGYHGDGRVVDGVRHIDAANLFEVSVVTFPADDNALITEHMSENFQFESIRDFERFLKDSGIPRSVASKVAKHGYSGFSYKRDASKNIVNEREAQNELCEMLKTLINNIGANNATSSRTN